MAESLHLQTLSGETDLERARSVVRGDDARAELRIGQTVSVYDFTRDGTPGQLVVWHETGQAAIDFGTEPLWGFWDEDSETIMVDDGGSSRQQFDCFGEIVAEFRR